MNWLQGAAFWVLQRGLPGKLLVALLALLVCVTLASLVVSLLAGFGGVTRYFVGFVLLVAVGVLTATRNFIAGARSELLSLLLAPPSALPPDPLDVGRRINEAMSVNHAAVLLAGTAFFASTLIVMVPIWRSDLTTTSRVAASSACGLVAFVAAFVVLWAARATTPSHFCEGLDPWRCRFDFVERMRGITDTGSTLLVVFALAALGVAGFCAFREDLAKPDKGLGILAAGALTLALGSGAFAATRGIARDAHRLVPAPAEAADCSAWSSVPEIPRAGARCEPMNAPLVVCIASGTILDGYTLPNQRDVEKALRTKRELWIHLNPGRRFPERVVVQADRDLPLGAVLPTIASARRAGYTRLGIASGKPQRSLTTASLGIVPRSDRCCATFFELDPGGRPLESFETWGDLHEAVARDPALHTSLR